MANLDNAKIYKKVSKTGTVADQYAVVNLDATNFYVTLNATRTLAAEFGDVWGNISNLNDTIENITLDNVPDGSTRKLSDYLPKIAYEWNKSISFGSEGFLKIGAFDMYDSNVTIEIDSTTYTTFHGRVVIATQNTTATSIGSAHVVHVYDDPTGTIASSLRVVWNSGSRAYHVYFVPQAWSKNLIHIRAVGLYGFTDICVSQTGTVPTTTAGLEPVNILNVNNASLIIQKNGVTVNTFTANASTDVTCDITVPTVAADVGALKNYGSTNSRPNGTTFTLPGGANAVQMRSGATSGSDIGIVYLSDDNAFICNSSDQHYLFAAFDTDKTADFSNAANAAFAVLSDHAGVSLKGSLTASGSIYEAGTALNAKYAALSHTHSYSDISDVSTIGTTAVSTVTISTSSTDIAAGSSKLVTGGAIADALSNVSYKPTVTGDTIIFN